MEIHLVSRNLEVQQNVRDYVQKKIAKLERYFPQASSAQVELSLENTRSAGDRAVVQVTLNCNGTLLRAQDRSADLFASIDTVSNALHRQLERYKAKLYRSENRRRKAAESLAPPTVEDEESVRVVRRKQFPMKPMAPEEAIDEMELLGHDFFLFMNTETQQFNVVYRRSAGDYGVIEPEAL
ncbi:MAG: ribosome-associated translation inhibitor RaiA [Dehalococcoidia bacterium]